MNMRLIHVVPTLVLSCAFATIGAAQTTYTFTTVAGAAGTVINSVDATGTAAQFDTPRGVAVSSSGTVYVADSTNHTIRKITAAGVVTTLAGSPGLSGPTNGTGSAARFNEPFALAVDSAGTVYVADTSSNAIRKITSAGVVTTLAGSGVAGGTDGTGTAATLHEPRGIALDSAGNLYVADYENEIIRKVTAAGVVTTIAGAYESQGSVDGAGTTARFKAPNSVVVDSAGNVFVSDTNNGTIRKITSAGVVSTFAGTVGTSGFTDGTGAAARFSQPRGLAIDTADNLYVADYGSNIIRKITPTGVVTTLAGTAPLAGSTDGTGTAARFNAPSGLAVDGSNNLYVADSENDTIRKITPAGVVTTMAGLAGRSSSVDGTGAAAKFEDPFAVAVSSGGVSYIADSGAHCIRKVTAAGVVTTLAGLAGTFGSTDGTGTAALFNAPTGVAVDSTGNVYVSDTGNHTVRKITSVGVVTTLAGQAGSGGVADGTGTAARFNDPHGIAVDSSGTVFVADAAMNTIRKITAAGVTTTLAGSSGNPGSTDGTGTAAKFAVPYGITLDSAGNIYVCDHGNHAIRKVTSAGVVTTLAGTAGSQGSTDGTGAAARFNYPSDVVADANGNVFVADTDNQSIRKISSAGVVTTIAGSSSVGSTDGVGTAAKFYNPKGIAIDGSGNLYIADRSNHTLRKGTVATVGGLAIDTQPVTQSVAIGGTMTLSVTVSGTPAATSYQWYKNGIAVLGATSATYSISGAASGDAADYTCVIGNGVTTLTTSAATITLVTASNVGRISNISVRSGAGSDSQTLIVGFVIGGTGVTGTKDAMVRALGPTLLKFGVTEALLDPSLIVVRDGTVLATNDNWSGDAQITAVGSRVGATPLDSASSKDAAYQSSTLTSGVYSAQITGVSGTSGVAVAEIYDATSIFTATTPRLTNVSARTKVGAGEGVVIAGFVIAGSTAKTVLIRGIGPTLATYGVTGVLADPNLELFLGSTKITENDNWGGGAALTAAFTSTGAFTLAASSKDAALLVTLQPGTYSAKLSGVGATIGVGLVEVYEVP